MINVHLGFQRSASTFLQKKIFAKLSEIVYLGKPYSPKINEVLSNYDSETFKKLIFSIFRDDNFNFDKKKFKKITFKQKEKTKTYLLSEEGLTSAIYVDPEILAYRIKKFFGQVKLIFVIRNQIYAVESLFNQYYKKSNLSLNFNDWVLKTHRGENEFYRSQKWILNQYDYNKYINIFERFFGKEYINILLFEDLDTNKKLFSTQLSNLLRIDNSKILRLIESSNKLNQSNKTFFKSILNFNPKTKTNSIFKEIYSNGNKKISQKYRLNLHKKGYTI
tara:strand:+ start:8 stop:838 length:831 start_codon:yes stop_codon:yes gene_type:complete